MAVSIRKKTVPKKKRRNKKKLFSYVPSPADHPFLKAATPLAGGVPALLPQNVDLRSFCLPIRNQFVDGPCAGFAAAAFREVACAVATGQLLPGYLSPAYLYALARQREQTFPKVSHTTLLDEFYVLLANGVCPEGYMPYNIGNLSQLPSNAASQAAYQYRILNFSAVNCLNVSIPQSVLANRQAIAITFGLYPSFLRTGADGRVPMYDPSVEQIQNGHAVLVCGYDIPGQFWIVRTEDTTFGDNGYCYMPFGYERSWTEAFTG